MGIFEAMGDHSRLNITPQDYSLLTDLYQLTMAPLAIPARVWPIAPRVLNYLPVDYPKALAI